MKSNSKSFVINSIDWKKIGTGAIIAITGALATYLLETIPTIDFGDWTPVVVSINSILVNLLRKWIADYSQAG